MLVGQIHYHSSVIYLHEQNPDLTSSADQTVSALHSAQAIFHHADKCTEILHQATLFADRFFPSMAFNVVKIAKLFIQKLDAFNGLRQGTWRQDLPKSWLLYAELRAKLTPMEIEGLQQHYRHQVEICKKFVWKSAEKWKWSQVCKEKLQEMLLSVK